MNIRSLSACLAAATLLSSSVFAGDLYVSISTGKNKNPGTKDAPIKSLFKAIAVAEPGDTLHIAEGKYKGKMSSGFVTIDKPLTLLGGYKADFSVRKPDAHLTLLQPPNQEIAGRGQMVIELKRDNRIPMVIDGIIFDQGEANSYHPVEGQPKGVETGMLTIAPAKGKTQFVTPKKFAIYGKTAGEVTIRNCAFVNCADMPISIAHYAGKVEVENNIFVANRMIACDVHNGAPKPTMIEFEFEDNTVLFTWSRTKDLQTMGHGVRVEERTKAKIEGNLFALNVNTGVDLTKGDQKTKEIALEENAFVLNKRGDVSVTVSPSILFLTAGSDAFDDLEEVDGMESIEENVALADPALLKGKVDPAYLEGFLAASYTEKTSYDENSPANVFRAAMGMNKVGKLESKVTMYANRYPLETALKLFGAVKDFGAQAIE